MMGYENTCLKNSRAISSRSRRIPRVPRLDGLMFYLYEDLTLSKGTFQKRFSGFFPLRGGVPPLSVKGFWAQ